LVLLTQQIAGTIPPRMSSMSKLQRLLIANLNQLAGTIPPGLGSLSLLQVRLSE
jgi:hypothetical protein